MAAVQTVTELNISPKMVSESQDILTMAVAALRINLNPWIRPQQEIKPQKVKEESAKDRVITLNEVAWHDAPNDCWVVIYDRVYDISTFLDEHPGGADIMLEYAGRDASTAFRGSGHSRNAVRAMERFLVGELPMHERIYRKPGGLKLSDMPE